MSKRTLWTTALMVMAGRSARARTLLLTGAALIAFLVGLTRLYLAAHWMTDVLGGWAFGGMWGCLLIIPYLFAQRAAATPGPDPGPGTASRGHAAAGTRETLRPPGRE